MPQYTPISQDEAETEALFKELEHDGSPANETITTSKRPWLELRVSRFTIFTVLALLFFINAAAITINSRNTQELYRILQSRTELWTDTRDLPRKNQGDIY